MNIFPVLIKLYIPLWFYSNDDYIHRNTAFESLYIPLWFYSNADPTAERSWTDHLYIPLWFYSNNHANAWDDNRHNFTFHYGSIQIRIKRIINWIKITLHSTMVLFKSQPVIQNNHLKKALHSTMVLFKSDTRSPWHVHKRLYIPLWFYSNCRDANIDIAACGFTFHYGSIQMQVQATEYLLGFTLHSTMVLFKCLKFYVVF